MKTIQINAVYGEKSTGLIVKDIQENLRQNCIEAYVAYQKASGTVTNGMKVGNILDWKVHAAYTRLTGKQGYASRIQTRRFLRYLDMIQPEIIHLHNLHANYMNLPLLLRYCAKQDIKTIITLHDCWFFTGKCFHFHDIACQKFQKGCNHCPKKYTDIPNYFIDQSRKVWNDRREYFNAIPRLKIIGCSEWISDLARKSGIFTGRDIITIHNGIDTTVFREKDRKLRKIKGVTNKYVILGMANKWLLSENKSVFDALYKGIKEDEIIVLLGCNEQEQKFLQDYKKILPMGYEYNREKLADIYSMADVFVNLSLVDTLPTVNMESIACGTPVICYRNSGGGVELIIEGKTGYVVDKFSVSMILQRISELKNGAINRRECSQIGVEYFDKNKKYQQYVKEYLKWE